MRFNYHPFAVQAHFDFSLVLTFALPKQELSALISSQLQLDTQKELGFVAVAIVKTKNLRPKDAPQWLGQDFILAGYRIFVKYINKDGKKRRGLYILKSQTDSGRMKYFGNLFTQYKYEKQTFAFTCNDVDAHVTSSEGLEIRATKHHPERILENSPFHTLKEARRYAGPMPYTFSFDDKNNRIITVKGLRATWDPVPVNIKGYKIPFLDRFDSEPILANAFITEKIDYEWTSGEIEQY